MPATSRLARLQQCLVGALLSAALGWAVWQWPVSPVRAIAGALAIALIHAPFLAAEFLILWRISRSDATPAPTAAELANAWWHEVWNGVRVFGWRQPFRWRAEPDATGPAAQGRRGIVFIHGFVCNRGLWTPWLAEMRRRGLPFVAVNLEPVFGSIDDYAGTIEEAVRRLTQATGLAPSLVCHSMGGLAARAWLRRPGAAARVHRVVTIGTPHRGTWLGQFSTMPNGQQMRLGSPWLAQLEADEAGRPQPPFTCWYSNCDNIVFPTSTATRPGADNRLLRGAAHVHMAFDPQLMKACIDEAAAPPGRPL